MDYFKLMERRLGGFEPGVPGYLGDKSATRPFAKEIGVKTPELYFRGTIAQLETWVFPEEFVIKPRFASTSTGVYLLATDGADFINLTTNEPLSRARLMDEYRMLSKRYYDDEVSGEYFVEELLRDETGKTPPADIRAYMFQGECGFILVEDHIGGNAAAAYFDENFAPMEDLDSKFGVADGAQSLEEIVSMMPPKNADQILSVAKRISTAVPTAFCRVDLYNTTKGIYLGEITFYPGTFYYKNRKIMHQPEADRLGAMWQAAEKRLAGSLLVPAPKAK